MNTILNLYSTFAFSFSFSFPDYDIKTLSFPKLLRTILTKRSNIESFKNNAFEFEFRILIFFYVTFYLNILFVI